MDEEERLRHRSIHDDKIEENESDPILRDELGVNVTIPKQEDFAFRAVAKNDLETVKRLLDDGYDINKQHEGRQHLIKSCIFKPWLTLRKIQWILLFKLISNALHILTDAA